MLKTLSQFQLGPTFSAYPSATQLVNNATFTKMVFDMEEWDTDNAFDNTTNYRFQPKVAGYYQVSACVTGSGVTTGLTNVFLYKNGSVSRTISNVSNAPAYPAVAGSALMYFNGTTDYAEVYVYQTTGAGNFMYNGAAYTFFQAHFVRGA
jgi:hypothetical protein